MHKYIDRQKYKEEKKIKVQVREKRRKKKEQQGQMYFVIGGGCPGLESTVCQFSSRTPNQTRSIFEQLIVACSNLLITHRNCIAKLNEGYLMFCEIVFT